MYNYHVTLHTRKTIAIKEIQAYIPTFNLSLDYKIGSEINTAKNIKLKQVIKDPLELTKLSLRVEEINHDVDNQSDNILSNKYFMYPVGSGTLVIIIIGIAGIIIWKVKKVKTKRQIEKTIEKYKGAKTTPCYIKITLDVKK